MKEVQSLSRAALVYLHAFMEQNGREFLFHNFAYVRQVVDAFKEISKNEGLAKGEAEIARLVVMFKDLGIVNGKDPRLNNQSIIDGFLSGVELNHMQLEEFHHLLEFARSKNEPKNRLEAVLRDSLHMHLASPDALEKINLLRLEREELYGQTYTDIQWLEICKRYFITHNFFTNYARERFGSQRYKNFLEIDRSLYKMKIDQQKQNKSSALEFSDGTLSFKEAEDLFKIAFRNYVDLVSVADRKAGLMINVNSIIISVVIAFAFRHVDTHPLFLVPTTIILLVAFGTIYFSVMASKPQEKIQNAAGFDTDAAFFFGSFDRVDNHFMKMKWEQYQSGLQNLINGNKGEVIRQITEETFIVRKVLAQKFKYISLAYKIFRYGLIATILTFLVFYLAAA